MISRIAILTAAKGLTRPVMTAVLVGVMLALGSCVETPAPDATGEEIYAQLCSRCHGPSLDGGVGPPLAAGSEASTRPDEQLSQTISLGQGRMPSFSNSLTDEQIAAVIRYLREQQAS